MGLRGPAPKPSRLQELAGNPGHRKKNTAEPRPPQPAGIPEPPPHLDDDAKAEWRRVAPILHALELLTDADLHPLAAYCQAVADFIEATLWIRQNGPSYTVRDDAGKIRYMAPVPAVGIKAMAAKQILQFAQQFGLSPSARTRLQTPANEKRGDDMELRLFGT